MKRIITEPENSTFQTVCVNLTQRCNLECASCYSPDRNVPDTDMNLIYEVLARMPKADLRLVGGEPTMRTDLPEIIAKMKSLGHHVSLVTNGLMLGRPGYAQELVDAGLTNTQISFNGGDDDKIYMIMDGAKVAARKIKGWEMASETKINVVIGTILQKGVNDNVPSSIKKLWGQIGGHPSFRYRNIMESGRWAETRATNWTLDEMVKLVTEQYGVDYDWARTWNVDNNTFVEPDHVWFPLYPEKKRTKRGIWIKVTDWNPPDPSYRIEGNKRRGILTPDLKLETFFGYLERTSRDFINITPV